MWRELSVSYHAYDFCSIAAHCSLNVDDQNDAFLKRLSETMKDEITTWELPATLDSLADLAIHTDTRLEMSSFSSQISSLDPEAMHMDRTLLSPAFSVATKDT